MSPLCNRLTDSGKVVSLAGRPLPPERFLVLNSERHSRLPVHIAAGRIRSIEKIHFIWTRNRDFTAYRIVP
jgi:hypothetical protein